MYLYTCQKCVAKPPPHPPSTARDSTTRKAAPLAANSEASDGAEAVEGPVITTRTDSPDLRAGPYAVIHLDD